MALALDLDTAVDTTAVIVADITDIAVVTPIAAEPLPAVDTAGAQFVVVAHTAVVAQFVAAAVAASYHARVY
jgi:hypothetical protein